MQYSFGFVVMNYKSLWKDSMIHYEIFNFFKFIICTTPHFTVQLVFVVVLTNQISFRQQLIFVHKLVGFVGDDDQTRIGRKYQLKSSRLANLLCSDVYKL